MIHLQNQQSYKLFDTAENLKYNHGHWKWYEWVKLNKYYHHAKFEIYHSYCVWQNCNVKVFATYGNSADKPAGLTLIIT